MDKSHTIEFGAFDDGIRSVDDVLSGIIEKIDNMDGPEPCAEMLLMMDTNLWWYFRDEMVVCKRCGQCCKYKNIVVWDMDIYKISKYFEIDQSEFIENYLQEKTIINSIGELKTTNIFKKNEDQSCIFLDKNNECEIYCVRPWNCFMFPMGVDRLYLDPECQGYKETLRNLMFFYRSRTQLMDVLFHINNMSKESRERLEEIVDYEIGPDEY